VRTIEFDLISTLLVSLVVLFARPKAATSP